MNCIKTSSKCLTGTDRVAEVAKKLKNFYINVQLMNLFQPKDLKKLLNIVKNKGLISIVIVRFAIKEVIIIEIFKSCCKQ